MVTSDFWNNEFPDGEYSKSAEEVQHINRILSAVAAQDIPAEKRGQVADYIHFALLYETIEPAIKGKLEHLLIQVQEFQAKEPLHKSSTHVLAHACRVRQHPGLCSNLILA